MKKHSFSAQRVVNIIMASNEILHVKMSLDLKTQWTNKNDLSKMTFRGHA